jgi:hypothetical protein
MPFYVEFSGPKNTYEDHTEYRDSMEDLLAAIKLQYSKGARTFFVDYQD